MRCHHWGHQSKLSVVPLSCGDPVEPAAQTKRGASDQEASRTRLRSPRVDAHLCSLEEGSPMAEHTSLLDAQRIQANGAILHTETRGSDPPVLLIAGAGGDAAGLAGRVDAAQPLGQFEGAFGLGAVYQGAAGLPAYPATEQAKAPLVTVGDLSQSRPRSQWVVASFRDSRPLPRRQAGTRVQHSCPKATSHSRWIHRVRDRRRYGTSTPLRWRPPTSSGVRTEHLTGRQVST
jgi:hypothetical protein